MSLCMHWFICLLVHSGFNALENQGDGEEAYVPYLCKLLLSKDKVNSMSTITLANYAYPVHVNPRNFLGDWFERKSSQLLQKHMGWAYGTILSKTQSITLF